MFFPQSNPLFNKNQKNGKQIEKLTKRGEEIWSDINKIVRDDETMRNKFINKASGKILRIAATQSLISNYLSYLGCVEISLQGPDSK